MPVTPRPLAVTLQVVSIVLFTFIGYLNIGIPLAVLPGYVHNTLGYGAVVAGLVISVQYLATLLSRPYASRIIDNLGSKRAVLYGLAGCGLSGVFMLLAAWLQATPWMSLTSLLVGRLVLGSAESLVGSGSIGWGIGRVGAQHTAKVISWNGIASYGALAIGAPLGVLLVQQLGLWSMGVSILLLAAVGLLLPAVLERSPAISATDSSTSLNLAGIRTYSAHEQVTSLSQFPPSNSTAAAMNLVASMTEPPPPATTAPTSSTAHPAQAMTAPAHPPAAPIGPGPEDPSPACRVLRP